MSIGTYLLGLLNPSRIYCYMKWPKFQFYLLILQKSSVWPIWVPSGLARIPECGEQRHFQVFSWKNSSREKAVFESRRFQLRSFILVLPRFPPPPSTQRICTKSTPGPSPKRGPVPPCPPVPRGYANVSIYRIGSVERYRVIFTHRDEPCDDWRMHRSALTLKHWLTRWLRRWLLQSIFGHLSTDLAKCYSSFLAVINVSRCRW